MQNLQKEEITKKSFFLGLNGTNMKVHYRPLLCRSMSWSGGLFILQKNYNLFNKRSI